MIKRLADAEVKTQEKKVRSVGKCRGHEHDRWPRCSTLETKKRRGPIRPMAMKARDHSEGACHSGPGRIFAAPGPRSERALFSRMPPPGGLSTGARSWPSSRQGIRWRQCRGCASDTYRPDARPNLLKLYKFQVEITKSRHKNHGFEGRRSPEPPDVQHSGPVTIAFKCMSQENACAHQAHHRCNCLDHRTNPLRPCNPQNDSIVAQSKRFTGRNRRSVVSDDLVQQIV
jgi:hypothetical protein